MLDLHVHVSRAFKCTKSSWVHVSGSNVNVNLFDNFDGTFMSV